MIYDNVKALAEKRGFSIASLEKEAKLSNGTIGKWQNATPNVDSLLKVANVLRVNVNTLLKPVQEEQP